jgi:hypothetical protein
MRRNVKKLVLNKETVRNLDPRLSGVKGGYIYSTATNCDACGSDGCVDTYTCGTSCCPWNSGCSECYTCPLGC